MSLITRTEKGSKLTIAEMDGNLTYLQANGFVDGTYSQLTEGTGAVLSINNEELEDAAEGTYENISPTGGSGTGLVVDITVNTGRGIVGIVQKIVNGGIGYESGETVTVQNTDIGGVSGTTEFEINEVDSTKISSIEVTSDSIRLGSTSISIKGPIESDSSITTSGDIEGNNIIAANQLQGPQILGTQLSITADPSNPFPSPITVIFDNLPTSNPSVRGQLWNDSGSLKISAGV
jgi:hypothetical protein